VASSTENATDSGGGADLIEKVAIRSVCGVEGSGLWWQGLMARRKRARVVVTETKATNEDAGGQGKWRHGCAHDG